jgi:UDP-N-acetylmuramate dehydrogenase
MLMEENKPLAPFTTFGIGGPARWFVEAASEEDVAEAAAWAVERGVPLFVLGGGSNLLVSDAGFDGLVLRVGLRGIAASQATERIDSDSKSSPGTTSQLAEELSPEGGRDPQRRVFVAGVEEGGFNPRIKPTQSMGALQAAEKLSFVTGHDFKACPERSRMGAADAPKPAGALAPAVCSSENSPAYSSVADQSAHKIYQVAAGEDWERFVQWTIDDHCAGVECLAGIPGTVGGTPVQNVGAYGQEVASSIERVRAFDLKERAFVEFSAAECGFAYRRSRFNATDRGRYIVTRVDYWLTPGGAPTVRYAELQRAFPEGTQPSLAEVAAAVRRLRQSKGMLLVEGDSECRSAGSFFKNPVVAEEQVRAIAARSEKAPPRFPAGPGAENEGRVKVPAAWLIEQAGFAKGYALGKAGISSRHTLALVNRGGATAAEVLALAGQIAAAVEARFSIRLEMEPVMVGFLR